LFFDNATPGTVTKTITITTIGNEALVGIDFRPLSGDLYAMSVNTRFYVLNLTTGAASNLTLRPCLRDAFRIRFHSYRRPHARDQRQRAEPPLQSN
jgi:hypothetical protein